MIPITIESPKVEKFELPDKLTPKNVQYYSSHTHELAHSQVHKASLFIEKDCIKYSEVEKCYYCLPLPGYNTTTYRIIKGKVGWICDCQSCQTKIKKDEYCPNIEEKTACSHILALYYNFKIQHWNLQGVKNDLLI